MKKRFILSLIIFAVLLSGVLVWITGQRAVEGITQDYLSRPQSNMEQMISALSSRCPDELSTFKDEARVLPEYWYLQIFTLAESGPTAWVDSRSLEGTQLKLPPVTEIPNAIRITTLQPNGTGVELFDIVAPFKLNHNPEWCKPTEVLMVQPPDRMISPKTVLQPTTDTGRHDGYIRLGFSGEVLRARMTMLVLQLLGVALGALVVFSLVVWLVAGRLFPAPTSMVDPLKEAHRVAEQSFPPIEPGPATLAAGAAIAPVTATPALKTESVRIETLTQPDAMTLSDSRVMSVGSLVLDDMSKQVQINGQRLTLTPKEYDILKLLASQPGRVFSNEEILKNVWPEGSFASSQDVKQYIYFLRRKIEQDPQNPERLVTVRGFGYKLNP
jgi:DNA-binding response OmpR family regulator